jgi:alpha/beta superfamily hydrolase
MRETQIVHVPSNDLNLEGILTFPAQARTIPGLLVCHPHPQYGGDMNNNVVVGVSRAIEELDTAVLRFNFRGVNGSQGSYDGGDGEISDVRAALSFLAEQTMVDNERLYLVGYSFGAFVGLQAAQQAKNLKAVVAVSPPVDMYDFNFLSGTSVPLLIVCGDRDSFCSLEALEDRYESVAGPKEKITLQGADHFYWGKEAAVGVAIKQFLRKHGM